MDSNSYQQPRNSSNSAMRRHEQSICNILTALISWHSPFAESDVLINLSSGVVATNDVQKDLMRAQVVGEETLEKFMTERLRGDIAGFYDPIPQLSCVPFHQCLKML